MESTVTVIPTKPTVIPEHHRGFVQLEPNRNLLESWKSDLTPRTDFKIRNAVVEEMQRRGLRPTSDIQNRELSTGVYPNISDPDFATKLFQKKEFSELSSEGVEPDSCDKSRIEFDTTPVQRLIARFLHPSTPYRGVLLNHGVGVGKTCTAITVAEMYLDLLPTNKVFIVAPVAIVEGFKRTIFDVSKLTRTSKEEFKLTGMYWKSNQCTGMTYLMLTGLEAEPNLDVIEREVDALIKKRYKFFSYGGFASWVTAQADKVIPPHIQGEERENKYKQNILKLFSDHLIVVDEAHNLRDKTQDEISDSDEGIADEVDAKKAEDAVEGKRLSPILQKIMHVAEGLRVMFMTATPMYNVAQDIMFLLNLLLLNDTKDTSKLMNVSDVFDKTGVLRTESKDLLASVIRRYVSFMRGENPNSFPLRLNPEERAGRPLVDGYPPISIRKKEWENGIELSDTEKEIMAELPIVVHEARGNLETQLTEMLRARQRDDGTSSSFNLDQSIQLCNFVYPDDSYGSRAFGTFFSESKPVSFGAYNAKQLKWKPKDERIDHVFSLHDDKLYLHSPKIAAIVQSVSAARGISFIYSRYLKSGALLVAIALEMNGWCRVMADGTPAPLLETTKGNLKDKPKYILLTSDEEMSPNFSGLLKYATTFADPSEAEEGKKVKAIIGSQVASEGLDLKCIRELHVLDGWFHLNRLEQIIGRGVRYCSHALLPKEKQNCTIYLHCVSLNEYETPDLFTYRVAVQKAAPIGVVSRLIKINAWDCALNMDAIQLKGLGSRTIETAQGQVIQSYKLEDKPYTGMCDFQESCEYACAVNPDAVKGENISTYKEFDFRRRFMERFEYVVRLFEQNDAFMSLKQLREDIFDGMPWSMVAAWLRKMLGSFRIKQMRDGKEIYGTLFVKNGYLVFQPEGVTDKMIPLTMRYGHAFGRIPQTMDSVMALEAPTQEEKEEVVSKPVVEDAPPEQLIESAMKSLRMWHGILKQFIQVTSGPLEIDAGAYKELVENMRYVYTHFAQLEETEGIGCKWWMDYIWTPAERFAVFSNWISRGLTKLDGDEKFYAGQFSQNDELFEKGGMRGFFIYKEKLECYFWNEGKVEQTTKLVDDLIAGKIDAPVDIESGTDDVFGFLTKKGEDIIFKSLKKGESKMGQDCLGSTNLENALASIRNIQEKLAASLPADAIFRKYLLDPSSSEEAKALVKTLKKSQPLEKRFSAGGDKIPMPTYCRELSKLQLCQYMEFMLRYCDRKEINGKRWFLSLVDMARKDAAAKEEKVEKKRGRPAKKV